VKQSIFTLTTLVTTSLISSNVAYADQKSDVQEIHNKYKASMDAEVVTRNYDVDRVLADYAPNYTENRSDGKVYNRAQVRQALLNFHNSTYGSYVTAIKMSNYQYKVIGQTIILRYNQKTDRLVYGHNSTNDLTRFPSTAIGSYEDTWQRQGSGWKLVNSRTLQQKVSYGQPQGVHVYVDSKTADVIRQFDAVENGWNFLRGVGVTPR
jgi:Domain of unknown function (DUF4440)